MRDMLAIMWAHIHVMCRNILRCRVVIIKNKSLKLCHEAMKNREKPIYGL